ncbi:MAG: hypothetical protein ACRD1K_00635 [Acidimicrobiales bacterium]
MVALAGFLRILLFLAFPESLGGDGDVLTTPAWVVHGGGLVLVAGLMVTVVWTVRRVRRL